MLIVLAAVEAVTRSAKSSPEALLVEDYRGRAERYMPCRRDVYRSPEHLLAAVANTRRQRAMQLILLDSSGEMLGSDQLAARVARLRDGGVQELWAAVGPADGWTGDTLAKADLRLSLGPITLPHRLAQVVLAEQIYRALTILAGHPYHCGH